MTPPACSMGPPQQQQPVTTRVCRSQHDVRARPAAASSKRSASPESEPANGNGVKRSGGNSDGALYKTRRKRKSTFIVRKVRTYRLYASSPCRRSLYCTRVSGCSCINCSCLGREGAAAEGAAGARSPSEATAAARAQPEGREANSQRRSARDAARSAALDRRGAVSRDQPLGRNVSIVRLEPVSA